jgi:hypothetical protein
VLYLLAGKLYSKGLGHRRDHMEISTDFLKLLADTFVAE